MTEYRGLCGKSVDNKLRQHYNDVIMSAMASQITRVSIVCSTDGSGVDQRKSHSSTSLAIVQGIHRWPVNSPHKRPVTRKMFPFDDVFMKLEQRVNGMPNFGDAPCHATFTRLLLINMIYSLINLPACVVQWNLSVTTTCIMKFITCDLFSKVF